MDYGHLVLVRKSTGECSGYYFEHMTPMSLELAQAQSRRMVGDGKDVLIVQILEKHEYVREERR
jgi:hypothetical protein